MNRCFAVIFVCLFFPVFFIVLLQSPASSLSSASPATGGARGSSPATCMASEMAGRLLYATVTCAFAVVGSFAGAVAGSLIGLTTESGFFGGAGIGAISGAVFSIEAVDTSFALWNSDESAVSSVLYVIDIIGSLLSGRLVREKVWPAVQSAVQSQMSAVDSPLRDVFDLFETGGGANPLSKDSIERLPTISITKENYADAAGESSCCSVCLQDFQVGEVARSLPDCQHVYHLTCIDSWLMRHASCPLCRRDIQATLWT